MEKEMVSSSSFIEFRMLQLSDGIATIKEVSEQIFKECNIAAVLVEHTIIKNIDDSIKNGYLISCNDNRPVANNGAWERYLLTNGYPDPAVINWELTSACNLKCPHCYARAGLESKDELSTHEALNVIDQLCRMRPGVIDFSGGEPLLRKDIFELVEYAKSKIDSSFTKLKLLTNGTLLTNEIGSKIRNFIDFVHISIDGIGVSHDLFRKSHGSYVKAIKGIRVCVQNKIPVGITSTIHEQSIDEVEDIIDLALELKVNRLRFGFFTCSGRGTENHFYNSITYQKKRNTYEYIARRAKELSGVLPIDTRDRFYGMMDEDKIEDKGKGYTLCRAGTRLLFISSQGYLAPCYMLNEPELYAGNVKNSDLRSLWADKESFKPFREMALENISQCRECNRRNICGGGMRCGAYGNSGNLLGDDPDCIFDQSNQFSNTARIGNANGTDSQFQNTI